MGFKIKQIPELVNQQSFKANNIVYSVKEVAFRYETQELAIEWKLTPEDWAEGETKQTQTQVIPFSSFLNEENLQMVLDNSDAIHVICMDFPFIPTKGGLKSFSDLKAETIDVGM